jgi:translation initiation factor IF-2
MARTRPSPPSPFASDNGLLPHERAARERAMGHTQPPLANPTASTDGLLPHERAAREKAMGGTRPPPTSPFASNDGLLPHERAAREKAMGRTGAGSKNRGPSWASASPSWSTALPPTPANSSPATPAQQADSFPSVPSQERLVNATVRMQDQSSSMRPQQADPLAFLLPHERAARSAAASRFSPVDKREPQGNMAGQTHESRDSRRVPQLSRNPLKWNQDHAGPSDSSFTGASHSGRSPSGRLGSISSLTQPRTDEGEWRNLTRRERTLPEGFGLPPSRDTPRDTPRDTSRVNTGSTSQGSGSSSAVDQWTLM